jgi:hypothetical protein
MTYSEAYNELQLHLQPDVTPTLSGYELLQLAAKAAASSSAVRESPSYASQASLTSAVVEGWRTKMAKASELIDFEDAAGQSFDNADVFAHCKAMLEHWESRLEQLGGRNGLRQRVRAGKLVSPDVSKLA